LVNKDCHAIVIDPLRVLIILSVNDAKAATALARPSQSNSVRLSVRSSHGWISQKQCKLGSPDLHHRLLVKESSFRDHKAFP